MWYNADYPATWAGVNTFLSGVLGLISDTLNAMLAVPVMALFVSASVLAVAYALLWALGKAAKS